MIVDLCCGAGAIGAALAAAVERAEVHAADIDPAAVRCARQNLPAGQVYQGDLYGPLPAALRGRVQILAANVPYVPTGEIGFLPPEARVHEPSAALDGGADGLDVLRRVAAGAPGLAGARRSSAERDQPAPGGRGAGGLRRPRPRHPDRRHRRTWGSPSSPGGGVRTTNPLEDARQAPAPRAVRQPRRRCVSASEVRAMVARARRTEIRPDSGRTSVMNS